MDSHYAAAYPELYRRHWWWRVREQILLHTLDSLLAAGTRDRRILDVGCGAGLFFDALQAFGTVEGIESDPIALDNSGRWRGSIFEGELNASFRPVVPYDAILMLDILEHVPNPEQLVHDAKTLLKSHGWLVITVPAFNWLWTRHDDMNHHLRRYSSAQLRDVVEGAGLVVINSTYLFQALVVPKALVKLKERFLPGRPQVPRVPWNMLNLLLQRWFQAEHRFAGWLPFGSSLMLVAKRED
jgi:2-polyprenyl-3-methyl-5-hydroxy-6-metoxy-1,4-benzoquinol methylase